MPEGLSDTATFLLELKLYRKRFKEVFSKDLSGFLRNIDAKVVFEGPEKNRESTSQQTNANKHNRKELWLARGSIVSHSSNESTGRP